VDTREVCDARPRIILVDSSFSRLENWGGCS